MNTEEKYLEIQSLLKEEKVEEALKLVENIIVENPQDDMAFYTKGNIYRKMQNWEKAINNYTLAIELNSSSPATDARQMCIEILNFYNTDMYNH